MLVPGCEDNVFLYGNEGKVLNSAFQKKKKIYFETNASNYFSNPVNCSRCQHFRSLCDSKKSEIDRFRIIVTFFMGIYKAF